MQIVPFSDPRTVVDKILSAHQIVSDPSGAALIHIDRLYMDESAYNCLQQLRRLGLKVRSPHHMYLMVSHLASNVQGEHGPTDPEVSMISGLLEDFTREYGIDLLRCDDPRQGIHHVVAPERGITLPGLVVAGTDSHMTTHGALGALGISVGYDEAVHVLVNDALWQPPLESILLSLDGSINMSVTAKDVALYALGTIGANGGMGACLEIQGTAVDALSIEGRMTLCNMALETGARAAIIAPDDKAIQYFEGLPQAPTGSQWDKTVAYWKSLKADPDALYAKRVTIDVGKIEPMVSWGTGPDQVMAIADMVPVPEQAVSTTDREVIQAAIDYMGLRPGQPIDGLPIDQVFIGSCTNGRIEDLRAAARVLRNRRAAVPGLVVPGSIPVKQQAEAEGLDRVFRDAGLQWGAPGCALCFGHHDNIVPPGHRCASTSNRSFPGRQGPGSRTHLMSPAMAAAAAITGAITDVRKI